MTALGTQADAEAEAAYRKDGFVILDCGLAIDHQSELTHERWRDIGARLMAQIERQKAKARWAFGDWINAFKGEWGDMYTEAVAISGYAYDYVMEIASVARAYGSTERSLELSWNHYRVARSLPEYQRLRELEDAFNAGTNFRAFHERVKVLNAEKRTPEEQERWSKKRESSKDHVTCPKCRHVFPIRGNRRKAAQSQ